jgi:hypothetical protein
MPLKRIISAPQKVEAGERGDDRLHRVSLHSSSIHCE